LSSFARKSLAAYQSVSAHGAVADADPHRLVQMLMDAAMERMVTARACIERSETSRKAKLLHSVVTLITELRGSLNLKDGGALAQNLSSLYEYMARQILMANVQNDVSKITEVMSLLGEIRSAWIAIGPEVRKGNVGAMPRAATQTVGVPAR
jgi:flagellar secretion chaperone FliS